MTAPASIVVAHPGAELYGSDRVLIDSVRGMIDAGNRVIVALPSDGPLRVELEAIGASVRIQPTFVLRKSLLRPSGWWKGMTSALRGARAARRLIAEERPAAVFVNTITLPLWVYVARLRRVPVILHVHEGEASAPRIVKRAMYAPALSATVILVNSEFSRDVMTSTFPSLDRRTTLLPNAVPGPPAAHPPRRDISDVVRVVYVGRLSPRKGPDLIVDALRLLDAQGIRVDLTLMGSVFPGYEWYEEDLRARVADGGLGHRVHLLGFRDDVWPVLEESDVVVVPSRLDEPFGNTAVEAILAARPVVVSETSGLLEATRDIPTAVRVEPDSAEAIARGIADVVRRWEEIQGRVEESRRIAESRHSPSQYRSRVAASVADTIGDTED